MADHQTLLDSFADARRTWDELVTLQPDIKVGSRHLMKSDLVELERRVEAHRAAVDMLVEAVETEAADESPGNQFLDQPTGISNRETAREEAREREVHPPIDTSSPPPEDAAGRVGEEPLEDTREMHTSHKAGHRSIRPKVAESRYLDQSMPAARKVAGAFGKEPR